MGFPVVPIIKHHFAQNSQQHSVCGLSLPITLRVVRCGTSMLDPVMFQHFSHILVYEWSTIVGDELVWYAKMSDYVLSDKVCNCSTCYFLEKDGFYPFCEVFGSHKNPNVTTGGRIDRADEVQPPSVKRPRCSYVLETSWVSMDQVGLDLASMACFHKICHILFHCRPIITKCKQTLVEPLFPLMFPTFPRMSFFHDHLGFRQAKASKWLSMKALSKESSSFHKIPQGQPFKAINILGV